MTEKYLNATDAAIQQLRRNGWRQVGAFAGPPRSGKSTRAKALCERLQAQGYETHTFLTDSASPADHVWARKK